MIAWLDRWGWTIAICLGLLAAFVGIVAEFFERRYVKRFTDDVDDLHAVVFGAPDDMDLRRALESVTRDVAELTELTETLRAYARSVADHVTKTKPVPEPTTAPMPAPARPRPMPGPATEPSSRAVQVGAQQMIERELGGRTFQFRAPTEAES